MDKISSNNNVHLRSNSTGGQLKPTATIPVINVPQTQQHQPQITSVLDTFVNAAQDLQLGNFDDAYDLIESVFPYLTRHRYLLKRLFFNVQDQLSNANNAIWALRDELKELHNTTQQLEATPLHDISSRAKLSWKITMQLISMPSRIQEQYSTATSTIDYPSQTTDKTKPKLLEYTNCPSIEPTSQISSRAQPGHARSFTIANFRLFKQQ